MLLELGEAGVWGNWGVEIGRVKKVLVGRLLATVTETAGGSVVASGGVCGVL